MKVGFIGLGKMGFPMATNLLAAGHRVTVYNRTKSRADELAARGAIVAGTPEACAGSSVVITMLPDDNIVMTTELPAHASGVPATMAPRAASSSALLFVRLYTVTR